MKKDVIYIDIEDDITSIIDKVKSAGAGIVALVPPKRVGVLQSAVNLKLLQRAAEGSDKRVVLITSDPGLSALAAGVKIPVAKNLQSRPEIASAGAPSLNDGDDVINGEDLPVGELARSSGVSAGDDLADKPAINPASSVAPVRSPFTPKPAVKPAAASAAASAGKSRLGGPKIPNFDTFRKKLFILGGLGVLLVAFLVWAFFFAPRATVTIAAKTSTVSISKPITLDPNTDTNPDSGLLNVQVKQIKKSNSTEFDTTGKKEVGNKASGMVTVTNCEYPEGFTIPAGTSFRSASGQDFTSSQAVSVPGFSRVSRCESSQGSVNVTANAFGPEYNIAPQSYDIGGIGGDIEAAGAQMSGGTREQIAIVAAADIEKAKQQLGDQDANDVKKELEEEFEGDVIVIRESFRQEAGNPNASPAVGEQAKRARLTVETTYTLFAAERDDVKAILNEELNAKIQGKKQQRIYDSGDKKVKFSEPEKVSEGTFSTQISATGNVGPVIDDKQLAGQVAGKRYGEIEQLVTNIEGVDDVDIKFSPFWVNKAPAAEKVVIKYTIDNNE